MALNEVQTLTLWVQRLSAALLKADPLNDLARMAQGYVQTQYPILGEPLEATLPASRVDHARGYHASYHNQWNYIGIDSDPPEGKLNVLTFAGISITGDKNTQGMLAWGSLMKRDKAKEQLIEAYKDDPEALRAAGRLLELRRLPPSQGQGAGHIRVWGTDGGAGVGDDQA